MSLLTFKPSVREDTLVRRVGVEPTCVTAAGLQSAALPIGRPTDMVGDPGIEPGGMPKQGGFTVRWNTIVPCHP